MLSSTKIIALTTILLASSTQARLFDAPANLKYTSDVQKFPQMPCATIDPHVYKLFGFYTLQTKTDYENTIGGKKVVFNMCTNPKTFPPSCPANAQYGYVLETVEGTETCTPLFISGKGDFEFKINADDTDKHNVKNVEFSTTWQKDMADTGLVTKFNLICDKDNKGKIPTVTFVTPEGQTKQQLSIQFSVAAACGEDAQRIIILFENFKILSIIFIIIALPLIFFGLKFIKASLATIGAIVGILFTAYIASNFTNFMAYSTGNWFTFGGIALIVAIIFALLCYHFTNIAVFVAGAQLGYFGGKQLVHLYAGIAKNSAPSDMATGIVIGICICIGFLLAVKLRKHVIILATSFGGAQLLSFGIGTLAGNYPDYKIMAEQIKNDDYKNVGTVNWIYFFATLVIFIIGAHHQYKNYMKKDGDGEVGDYGKAKEDGFNSGDAEYY